MDIYKPKADPNEPVKPKKPTTAFLLYVNSQRAKLREEGFNQKEVLQQGTLYVRFRHVAMPISVGRYYLRLNTKFSPHSQSPACDHLFLILQLSQKPNDRIDPFTLVHCQISRYPLGFRILKIIEFFAQPNFRICLI